MARRILVEQFENPIKQKEAARLGMWAFLGSEVLLFTGLFALYASYRAIYPAEFAAGVAHNDLFLGTTNTFILLTSSFTVAMAVHEIRQNRARLSAVLLFISVLFGAVFLALKFTEYGEHFREGIYPGPRYHFAEMPGGAARIFFTLYFFMTGLHALHVTAGMSVLTWVGVAAWRRQYSPEYHTPLELGALYWHLVDVVWIFLWPCLYLMHE